MFVPLRCPKCQSANLKGNKETALDVCQDCGYELTEQDVWDWARYTAYMNERD
jgi:uncharacterized protein (DUF983 family)